MDNNYNFYQSFLNLYNITEYDESLKDPRFRKYLITNLGRNFETVKLFGPALQNSILKPQRLIYDDDDYYIAIDMLSNTYYICYKNLLMIDIDFYKDNNVSDIDTILEPIERYCDLHPTVRFRIYKSRNGIHAFLISSASNNKSEDSINIMLELNSDFYYTIYSYLRGWSVRLNRKLKEVDMDTVLYTYIKDIGAGEIDENMEKLCNLHINLLDVFKDVKPCMMYGG